MLHSLIRNQSKSHHVSLLNQPIDVFLESQDCYLRLDRDDHNVNISTMRSNLMELFVEAFDPKLFQEINRPQRLQRQASNSSTSSNDAMISNANFTAERNFRAGMLRQRVRELLVDLRPPQFQAIPSVFHTELAGIQQQRRNQPSQGLKLSETDYDMIFHLCAPPLMGKAVYHQALLTLLNYRASNAVIHPNNPTSSTVNTTPIPGQYFISPSGLTIYPGCHPLALYHEFLSLNIAQQQAILKVLSCLDYVLLWGLPGTGKTYTLCVLIRILIARGETVLLTSYTHNAVDHILSMLYDRGVGQHIALRLHGSSSNSQIPATIVGTALVEADTPNIGSCKSIAQYTERLLHVRLFVSTILTVSRHVLYKSHRIMTSYCIIDEAGQITTPVILAGFLHAQKYVLAGDDYQLPPLVINQDAVQAGMDISLLKQLMTKEDVLDKNTTSGSVAVASTTGVSQVSQVYEHSNHDAITTLFIQYRMNSAIMSLSNTLIYQGKMQCGNEQVANQLISLPGLDLSLPHPTLPSIHPMSASGLSGNRSDWLYQALHPNRPVVFLNNDGLINSTNTSYTVENLVDAKLIYQLLYGFEAAKLPINTEVSVISPFRAQVSLMQQMIKASNRSSHPLLREYEASTVDKYQGKDKDIIIFNTVRTLGTPSNEATSKANGLEQQVGMLLKDWRRINVALTR